MRIPIPRANLLAKVEEYITDLQDRETIEVDDWEEARVMAAPVLADLINQAAAALREAPLAQTADEYEDEEDAAIPLAKISVRNNTISLTFRDEIEVPDWPSRPGTRVTPHLRVAEALRIADKENIMLDDKDPWWRYLANPEDRTR